MAGTANDLTRLLALLRSLGNEDYAALTSRGLVRRARKELPAAEVHGWVDGQAEVAVGPHTVRIPLAGPAQATCTCPAPGSCQHVVAACWALVEQASAAAEDAAEDSEPGADPRETEPTKAEATADAWSAVDLDTLKRWAGAGDWRHAVKQSREATVESPTQDGPMVVQLPEGIEVRLPVDAALDALITSAPARLRKRAAAAAVLAIRASEDGWREAAGAEDAVRLPVDLLAAVAQHIEECVRLGLNRLTPSTLARFETLAVECQSGGLYRAARELDSCTTEVRRISTRDAQADSEQLLERLARLYALVTALRQAPVNPEPDLVGRVRTTYREGSEGLDLVGCGAYTWRAPSGFHGLTALFWDRASEHYVSWSDARPEGSGDGFDPQRRYEAEGPWTGSGSVERLCRSRFTARRARLNEHRRLSSSGDTKVESLADVESDALPPAILSWSELRRLFESLPVVGLRRPSPLDFVVRVRPKRFHKPRFDEIEQCLVWVVEDAAGDQIPVVLPFSQENANAIQWIEKHGGSSGDSLIVYYQGFPRESFFPVARVSSEAQPKIDSLAFAEEAKGGWLSRLLRKKPASHWTPGAELDPGSTEFEPTPLRQLLAPVQERLVHFAESGLAMPLRVDAWSEFTTKVGSAGLGSLSAVLDDAIRSPADLLRATYVVSLYRQLG